MNCSASIVYSNSWTGQTAAIGSSGSPVTLYTPTAKGFYRYSVGMMVTSGTGTVHLTPAVGGSGIDGFNSDSLDFLVYSLVLPASAPFQMWTVIVTGSPTYDLFVTLEQLQ